MNDLARRLAKDGFIHIPAALSSQEVSDLRGRIDRQMAQIDQREKKHPRRMLLPKDIFADENIWKHMLAPAVVHALKQALGDSYIMLLDAQIQRNLFGSWHTDSDTEAGADYLFEPDYKFVKCGIYLQDNTVQWGGGIQVLKRGHQFPLITRNANLNYFVRSKRNKLISAFNRITLPLKAGDFLAFDSRLPHSATHPAKETTDYLHFGGEKGTSIVRTAAENTKYALYWDATSTYRYAAQYCEDRKRRAEIEEISRQETVTEIFLTDFLRMSNPESAPDFYKAAAAAGVSVFGLPASESQEMETRFQTLDHVVQRRVSAAS